MADANTPAIFTLRGKAIREDAQGRLCLDDIWELTGAKETRAPARWRRQKAVRAVEAALFKKITFDTLLRKTEAISVFYSRQGRGNTGTYAHPIMAAAYAGYLSPQLEIEVREVWLRFRAGDASLADEILQRASPEDNRRVGVRALSRAQRVLYTDTLRDHGVKGVGYPACTDAVYVQILGERARNLKTQRGLAKNDNLRDHLKVDELSFVMAAEELAAGRIEELNVLGNQACERASARSAHFIREAIERDRADRKKPAA